MPLNAVGTAQFESWEQLLHWLPEASESQLVTVFVWAGDQKAPGGTGPQLAEVRKQAFEHLVHRTRERLKRFLLQRCGCRDIYLAEDVVQQVLIKVYLRAEQYDPRRSFWGWLYRIARNEYIDCLRRLRPGDIGVGQAGQAADEQEQWLESLGAAVAAPDQALLDQERRQRLERTVAALPKLQRSVVERKLAGAKGKDIAVELEISQAYVSQLFHEAVEILREAVEQ
jgi:RNA polymerase sigma factor (sigma-70 family)